MRCSKGNTKKSEESSMFSLSLFWPSVIALSMVLICTFQFSLETLDAFARANSRLSSDKKFVLRPFSRYWRPKLIFFICNAVKLWIFKQSFTGNYLTKWENKKTIFLGAYVMNNFLEAHQRRQLLRTPQGDW